MYTGGLENHPDLVDRIRATRPLLGNPGSVLAEVRDPFQVGEVYRRAGISCPAVARESAFDPGMRAVASQAIAR